MVYLFLPSCMIVMYNVFVILCLEKGGVSRYSITQIFCMYVLQYFCLCILLTLTYSEREKQSVV